MAEVHSQTFLRGNVDHLQYKVPVIGTIPSIPIPFAIFGMELTREIVRDAQDNGDRFYLHSLAEKLEKRKNPSQSFWREPREPPL